MDSTTSEFVRRRAGHRCEYCLLPQTASALRFHIDPDTGTVTALFHPRKDTWAGHFARDGARIIGKTPTGRTTVWLLEMNPGERLRWREMLARHSLLD